MSVNAMPELLEASPAADVREAEYRRLLGYPRGHEPGERALALAAQAREWFGTHGRPWFYLREAALEVSPGVLRLDGVEFGSRQLQEHLLTAGARRAVLCAVSAGRACEEEARRLWEEAKPDEYFFLETFGSAVVEHLVASASGRICALAGGDGLVAIPHYSPGYAGWDVTAQRPLWEVIRRGAGRAFPEPLQVLETGMLRPKKSQLAVFGLAPLTAQTSGLARMVPCRNCPLSPCAFRRAPYRHAPPDGAAIPDHADGVGEAVEARSQPLARDARYTINRRALEKWARERVRLEFRGDRSVEAWFRYDGTTCSNMGWPLAFEYHVTLGAPEVAFPILRTECLAAPDDTGFSRMCEYRADAAALLHAMADEKPLAGRPLDDVLGWDRPTHHAGCVCDPVSRLHKWGLALEVIHYALVQSGYGIGTGTGMTEHAPPETRDLSVNHAATHELPTTFRGPPA